VQIITLVSIYKQDTYRFVISRSGVRIPSLAPNNSKA
jgi:hypothetical protein